MKTTAKITFYLISLFGIASCDTPPNICINGTVDTKQQGDTIRLSLANTDSLLTKAVINADGQFSIQVTGVNGQLLMLYLPEARMGIPIYADNEEYLLTNEADHYFCLPNSPKKNSQQNYLVSFLKKFTHLEEEYQEMCKEYGKQGNMQQKALFSEKLSKKFQSNRGFLIEGIRQFQGTEIAAYLACQELLFLENDFNYFTQVMNAVGEIPDNHMSRKLKTAYEKLKATQMSGEAPDFELNDMQGEKVKLSSFKGKYVLLDFWASWCAPCRAKNKELFKLYPELKQKKTEVISVSLDDNRNKWLQAIKEDRINWIQLADLSGFNKSEVARAYKVKQVPTVFFIDPQGIILKTNPSKEDIFNILK